MKLALSKHMNILMQNNKIYMQNNKVVISPEETFNIHKCSVSVMTKLWITSMCCVLLNKFCLLGS